MRKILITGVCGFVGKTLAESLLDHAAPGTIGIVGIDNLSRPGSWLNREPLHRRGIQVVHGDIRSASDVAQLGPVDWIVDAAANPSVLAGVDGSVSSRQLIEHNLAGTINLLEACKVYKAGLTLLSTSRVYSIDPLASLEVTIQDKAFVPSVSGSSIPGFSSRGVSEYFSTEPPVSLYGASKLASEVLALEYGAAFDFPIWINRCGVMAGAGQFGKADQGIFSFWLHSWAARRPLKYIGFDGMGHQVRDCLHPRDLANVILRQIEELNSSKPKVCNFGGRTESSISLANLSDWCEKRFGKHLVTQVSTPRKYDLPWVVLDASRAEAIWNWRPATLLPDILEEIAAHAERVPNWLDVTQ